MKPRVGIIGAGRVGALLTGELRRIGGNVFGVADRVPARARAACRLAGPGCRSLTATRVAAAGEVLFLTVPDREIARVFAGVRGQLRPGALVAHCSGFHGLELFAGARELGLETLAFHPAIAVAATREKVHGVKGARVPVKSSDPVLRGCTFALDGSPVGLRFGRRLARELGGASILVRGPDRPLYHAMCVFASNFLHALRESAERIAGELDIPPARRAGLLDRLMQAALANLLACGAGPGLTGPVRRGDAETIAGHLTALDRRLPELVPAYTSLTLRLVETAGTHGTGPTDLRRIRRLLAANRPRCFAPPARLPGPQAPVEGGRPGRRRNES